MDLGLDAERIEGGSCIISLSGEIDVYTSPRLRSKILEQFDSGSNSLIVDLSKVEYLDSSGLGVLVAGLKRSRERGGHVILVAPKPRIARVLEVTGLDTVFAITDSIEQAREKLERK